MDRTVALERSRIASRTAPECFRAGDSGSSAGVGTRTLRWWFKEKLRHRVGESNSLCIVTGTVGFLTTSRETMDEAHARNVTAVVVSNPLSLTGMLSSKKAHVLSKRQVNVIELTWGSGFARVCVVVSDCH